MMSKNTLLPVQTILQSRGRLLDLSRPQVMGILNATPDSFYNKGRESSLQNLCDHASRMLEQGAAILDIGGASTKPGSPVIDVEEELRRVIPVMAAIHQEHPDAWISVDTYHARVAREAVAAGASLINDVSSGRIDPEMIAAVAELGVPYIAMHMQGLPENMQDNPEYGDVVAEVREELRLTCDACRSAGISDIIIDPGFGFGKTVEHNYSLLRGLHSLRILGRPVLAGLSRKSMVCKPLQLSPDHALNGTTALHMIALQQGASILRVHDVKEAAEVIRLFELVAGLAPGGD